MAALFPPPPGPRFVLRGAQSAVNTLHFCPPSQAAEDPLLFSGSQNGLVHIWSLQTRRRAATLDGHGGQGVIWLKTLPQGQQLLSQGRDLRLCLWDLAEGRNTVVDSVHLDSVGFCRSSILVRGQPCWMLAVPGKGSDESNSSLRPLLLAGYEDGSVTLWDISERKVCSQITCHEEPVMGLDFDSQKAKGVSGSAGKALAVWSLGDQQSLQVKKTHELTNPGVAEVTIRPDRKLLATAGWDHRIRVFHWRTMKPLAVLAFHSAPVYCVAFAADGLLAAGSKDQRISIWSLYPRP
ncbi:guanine nucleotide-binding protein subunit beta-like protein 1 isoform X2 [Apodemus sylvaticus]|uniref:guanine nucleotide-binding protein subunit beta-like protein 1 isoform X2 n=1 Tax=Apodemus sylvaticus TaxID=10129 RepID=UPI002243CC9C|nr:guanine nucleotide-binding protein subunit beta-like protein 1 isoform X2 [Apodemus sylvaticus]